MQYCTGYYLSKIQKQETYSKPYKSWFDPTSNTTCAGRSKENGNDCIPYELTPCLPCLPYGPRVILTPCDNIEEDLDGKNTFHCTQPNDVVAKGPKSKRSHEDFLKTIRAQNLDS